MTSPDALTLLALHDQLKRARQEAEANRLKLERSDTEVRRIQTQIDDLRDRLQSPPPSLAALDNEVA